MNARLAAILTVLSLLLPAAARAQVQLRLADGHRGTYSELHEALKPGTKLGDSVAAILRLSEPRPLWLRLRAALAGKAPWNDAYIALTRLAQVAPGVYADSAAALAKRIEQGSVKAPVGQDPADLLQSLAAVGLERRRRTIGDAKLRDELLTRVRGGEYGIADAWTLGRLGANTADSIRAQFLAVQGEKPKVQWLTLLTFSADTTLIPLMGRIFAAPDSFGVPLRNAGRASDALMWIGTRAAYVTLRDARTRARARGIYADPKLGRGGYDFLDNDSSLVIARTGRWIDSWIGELKPGGQ